MGTSSSRENAARGAGVVARVANVIAASLEPCASSDSLHVEHFTDSNKIALNKFIEGIKNMNGKV